jgi:hypothetical protein
MMMTKSRNLMTALALAAVTGASANAVRRPLMDVSAPATSPAISLVSASMSRISQPDARLIGDVSVGYLVWKYQRTRPSAPTAASPTRMVRLLS